MTAREELEGVLRAARERWGDSAREELSRPLPRAEFWEQFHRLAVWALAGGGLALAHAADARPPLLPDWLTLLLSLALATAWLVARRKDFTTRAPLRRALERYEARIRHPRRAQLAVVALASGGGVAVLWDIVLAHGEGAVPSVAYWATWAGVHLLALAGGFGLVRHLRRVLAAPEGTEIVAEILGPEEDEHEAGIPRHAPWPSDERRLRG